MTYNLMVACGLPWFLQWAGVICAIFGCFGRWITRDAGRLAILLSFLLAAVWWSGFAFRFRGMDGLEALLDLLMFEAQSQFGTATTFDEILFHFVGPILNPFQLCGPAHLRGWNFAVVMLSTTLVVGYPLVVGRLCRIGSRSYSVVDYVKFVAAMLPWFLPAFIRLWIAIWRMQ